MELNDNHQSSGRRETMLTIMLTVLVGGAFLLFLIFVTGGFFFYVFLSVAVITAVGYFHYLLWGQSMTDEVADEQAHDAALEQQRHESELLRSAMRHKRF
ncbi:MAG TPA: hypothetical protein VE988_01260 [Gemmataceae bacterium]|nr:hypothetical protein [Gemmataceae bacterium]